MRKLQVFVGSLVQDLLSRRWLAEEATDDDHTVADDDNHGDHSEFGVHIVYEDLYRTVVFLVCIYVAGQIASRILRMPCLVGEIICGILLGPPLADFVPNPKAWVLLGELGLILLVIEAGVDIDLSTLQLIGTRGFLVAFVGSVLPIGIGMFIAWLVKVGDTKAIISAGAVFGPTSLGIALNILRGGGVLNTPVGQLIISAAVIDDMIALVILSQLEALTGEISVAGVVIPIVSALLFLVLGGYVAIFVLPPLMRRFVLSKFDEGKHASIELIILFILVLILMPATHYAKASYLMGSFIAGLAFCSSHGFHVLFVRQFKRLLQWLMRIFFSASIGFQVPIKDFGDVTVLWQGLVFTLALLGKVAVGFMVPNFTQAGRFRGKHLRDCLITGFSMAAEGEFAFVIAVFAVDGELISKDVYASVVFAVLLSTIIPPFLLRFTISYYNRKGSEAVELAAIEEKKRKHDLDSAPTVEESLVEGIRNKTTVFVCIQTQSESKWGLQNSLMQFMAKKGLDVIDHRAWSPRGYNTTLVNEVYARTHLQVKVDQTSQQALEALLEELREGLEKVINQPDTAKVKVQRWFPGVVEEIVEEMDEKVKSTITQRLLNEASVILERKQHIQTTATKAKTLDELMGQDIETGGAVPEKAKETSQPAEASSHFHEHASAMPGKSRPRRRVRQKMRSTPVVGGGLFGETIEAKSGREGTHRISDLQGNRDGRAMNWESFGPSVGIPAELNIEGETYNIRISQDTMRNLQRRMSGPVVDSRGIELSGLQITVSDDAPVVQRLQGFVRHTQLNKIQEETLDEISEVSGDTSRHGEQSDAGGTKGL